MARLQTTFRVFIFTLFRVFYSLLETGIESVVKRVKKDLKTWTRPNSEEHAKGLEVLEEALADS